MTTSQLRDALLDHLASYNPRPGQPLDFRMYTGFMADHGMSGSEVVDLLNGLAENRHPT